MTFNQYRTGFAVIAILLCSTMWPQKAFTEVQDTPFQSLAIACPEDLKAPDKDIICIALDKKSSKLEHYIKSKQRFSEASERYARLSAYYARQAELAHKESARFAALEVSELQKTQSEPASQKPKTTSQTLLAIQGKWTPASGEAHRKIFAVDKVEEISR